MPTYIALLRGINVSGQKLIRMTDLQSHFTAWGASDVRTYIQSGNVVFAHPEKAAAKLRRALEQHLANHLGFAVPTLVLPAAELQAIAADNPYDPALPEFGRKMYVCFFEKPPDPAGVAEIQKLTTAEERLVIRRKAGYAYYQAGLGKARLTSAVIERKLGLATLRNWNTVQALLELAQA